MALRKIAAWSPQLMEASDSSPEVGWITLGELHYDLLGWRDGVAEGYQRPIDEARARRYLDNFDAHLLGVITVSRRADGSLWVIDGQHRCWVLQQLGKSVALAAIYSGLTRQQEAIFYNRLNVERVTPNRWNQFGARASGGDPRVLAIVDLAAGCGFRVGTADRSAHSIAATSMLEKVYGWPDGPQLLRQVLPKIKELWPADVTARDGVFIEGLALLVWNYDGSYYRDQVETIDWRRFDDVFSKTRAVDIMRRAKELKIEAGFEMNAATYALAFRDIYNGNAKFRRRLGGKMVHPASRRSTYYRTR